MRLQFFTMLILSLFLAACNGFFESKSQFFVGTITQPDKSQQFNIPLSCEGWCIWGLTVVENTTDDSIRIGEKYFSPGQIGKVFSMEGYDVYKQTPWTYTYIPYKATKGKIVLKWYIKSD